MDKKDTSALLKRWNQLELELYFAVKDQEQWIAQQRAHLVPEIEKLTHKLHSWKKSESERYTKALRRKKWSPLSWLRYLFPPTHFSLIQELRELGTGILYPTGEEQQSWEKELWRLRNYEVWLTQTYTDPSVLLISIEMSDIAQHLGISICQCKINPSWPRKCDCEKYQEYIFW